MTQAEEIRELRRELRAVRRLLGRLTQAVYTHTRTDIRPDAALPAMRKLLDEVRGRR